MFAKSFLSFVSAQAILLNCSLWIFMHVWSSKLGKEARPELRSAVQLSQKEEEKEDEEEEEDENED